MADKITFKAEGFEELQALFDEIKTRAMKAKQASLASKDEAELRAALKLKGKPRQLPIYNTAEEAQEAADDPATAEVVDAFLEDLGDYLIGD